MVLSFHSMFEYPFDGRDSVSVHWHDLRQVESPQFLNDVVIEFYLKFLMHSTIPEFLKQETHFFSSYFYSNLTATSKDTKSAISFEKVKKWTSKVDIFQKKYLFIPINEKWVFCFLFWFSHPSTPFII